MKILWCILICGVVCTVESAKRPLEISDFARLDTRDVQQKDEQPKYRLPQNVAPETYKIELSTSVDKEDFAFTGKVQIKIHAVENTTNITLHARQLTITKIGLTNIDLVDVAIKNYTYDVVREFVVIPTVKTLVKDQAYFLTINYVGELRTDMGGFYRSSYVNAEGKKRWLATTQFESTNARHAFPCFDEPALKAKFTIQIEHGESYTAISNMPATRDNPQNGRVVTKFSVTPVMSTYLIAFLVSDFEYKGNDASVPNTIPHRVFTDKDNLNQTAYALSEGEKILNAIAGYVNVSYSLPKMDQAAIPDFRAGAMENWGLVTYRVEYLLFDPSVHSAQRQLTITTIIAHEFGHQWFGNLVSPKWWKYIWLNEGFATLFETLGSDLVHPEWNLFHHFVVNQMQPVLRFDATSRTRAMSTDADSPESIQLLFDSIAYPKSGSVLRMFMHALTESTFKKGLKYYLDQNAYKSAEESDLFASLDQAAKEDQTLDSAVNVTTLFGSWSNQKGFPLLKVTRNDNGSLTLQQHKYEEKTTNSTSLWWIPYNFATASNANFTTTAPSGWLSESSKLVESKDNETWQKSDWLVFNKQQTGFYRVLYDEQNYDLINKELNKGNHDKIHAINRAQLIDDLRDFARAGHVKPKHLFATLSYLKKERAYAPWVSARRAISQLKQELAASEKHEKYQKYVSKLVEPLYKNFTLEAVADEALFDKFTRSIAVATACEFKVKECLEETYNQFQGFLHNSTKLSQHNRGLILTNGIRSANETEVDKLWDYYLASKSDDERREIMASLANLPSESAIQRYLNKAIEQGENITISESERLSIVTTIVRGSLQGASLTIDFVIKDLDKVNSTIGSVMPILNPITGWVITTDLQNKFNALLELVKGTNISNGDKDTIDSLKNIVAEQVDWQKKYLKELEDSIPNASSKMAIVPSLLVLLLCIVRWTSN